MMTVRKGLIHRYHVSVCVSEQETGGRQMLHIMYQSTASKIVLQMRILMRGSVCGSRNSLIILSQLHLFSLCLCVCMQVCVVVRVHACMGVSVEQWADEPTFVWLKRRASHHISSFPSLTLCSKSGWTLKYISHTIWSCLVSPAKKQMSNTCLCSFSFTLPLLMFSSQNPSYRVENHWAHCL